MRKKFRSFMMQCENTVETIPDVTNGILVYMQQFKKVEKKSKINSENSVDLSEKNQFWMVV